MRALRRALLLLLTALLLGGCAVQTAALRQAPPAGLPARAELAATPFFPQTEYQCGPAALATALGAAGFEASPQQLGDEVFLPARTGTLQIEMIAGARRQGAVATRLPATLEALLRELDAGQPVVVLLNLGLSWYPLWHYAVLVGYDLEGGDILLRSGTTERAVLRMNTFEHTWTRAGSWAFVVTPPGRWPATAQPDAIVDAAVGFERSAAPAQAVTAYRSALQRVPDRLSLQIGLGNSLYAGGDKAGAAEAFAAATAAHPDSGPAWLNLATTLAELGRRDAAREAAQRAQQAGGEWSVRAETLLRELGP